MRVHGQQIELDPNDEAQASGTYEMLNVFGTPTVVTAIVRCGDRLPSAPRSHTWRLRCEIGRNA
jgi:hypothetical protein